MTFKDAKHTARMTTEQIAEYLNLSLATIKRYEKTGNAPKAVIECLRLIGGQLPAFAMRNDFKGWSFGGGFLWSPAGERFTSGDILAIIYDKQLIRNLQTDLNSHKKQFSNNVSAQIIQFPVLTNKNRNLA